MFYHDWFDAAGLLALPAPVLVDPGGVDVLVTVITTTLCVAVGASVVEANGSTP